MKTFVGERIWIENPTDEVIAWCKKNLVLANPEYAKKQRMGFWTGNIPRELHLYEIWDGTTYVIPFGCFRAIFPLLQNTEIKTRFHTSMKVDYQARVPLYDWQETAVKAMAAAHYGILQSPAGSGKTQMGIALMAMLGVKTLWLTHTLDLLEQSKARAAMYIPSNLIGTISGGKVEIGRGITFATVQTLSRLDLSAYRDMWDSIIVDECFKGDTEVLTDRGFLQFDKLSGTEKVAQYNENGTVEFVTPIRYIKRHHNGALVKLTVKNGRDVYMTENHIQPLYFSQTNSIEKIPIKDISFRYGKSLIVAGKGTGNNERLTPLERLAIASQADGTIQRNCKDHNSWTVQFKKDRKIERFLQLMKSLSIPWREIKAARAGCRRFSYQTPVSIGKRLDSTFDLNMGVDRARDFIQEICRWDGSEISNYDYYYSSTVKENAELVSAIAFLAGYQSTLSVQHDPRSETYSDIYRVFGNHQQHKDTQACKRRYVPYTGDVYCVEVPSHMIVVRADGYAFVTGNCHRVAGTPTAVTQFSHVLNSLAARHKYGLSATVHRADGLIQATYALLGQVMYTVPDEAVRSRVLRVSVQQVNTGTPLHPACLNPDGTVNYSEMISYLTEDSCRNSLILSQLAASSDHYNLILSARVKHLKTLISSLPATLREQSVMIDGSMTSKSGKAMREQALEDMRAGRKRYLFATFSLAKEGLDIPRLDRLFMVTPQKDYAVIVQSIGRIARTFPGKDQPVVYDYVDSIRSLQRAYRQRCTVYRKQGCEFL